MQQPKATIWLHTYSKVVNTTSQIISGAVIAHTLGAAGYGKLSYIQGLIALASPLINLGTRGNLMRELGENHNDREKIIEGANKITLVFATIAWVGLIITMQPMLTNILFLIACFSISIEGRARSLSLTYTNLPQKIERDIVITIVGSATRIIGAITLKTTNEIITVVFFSYLVEAILRRISNKKLSPKNKNEKLDKKNQITKKLLKEAITLTPTYIANAIASNANMFWIKTYQGIATLGEFNVAKKEAIAFQITNQIIYERFFTKQKEIKTSTYVIITIMVTLLGVPLIPFIYGTTFKESMVWAVWLIIPNTINIYCNIKNLELTKHKKPQWITLSTILGTVVTLLLNTILIPTKGIQGACIALSIGNITQLAIAEKCLTHTIKTSTNS